MIRVRPRNGRSASCSGARNDTPSADLNGFRPFAASLVLAVVAAALVAEGVADEDRAILWLAIAVAAAGLVLLAADLWGRSNR
jgi:hypothetical protein